MPSLPGAVRGSSTASAASRFGGPNGVRAASSAADPVAATPNNSAADSVDARTRWFIQNGMTKSYASCPIAAVTVVPGRLWQQAGEDLVGQETPSLGQSDVPFGLFGQSLSAGPFDRRGDGRILRQPGVDALDEAQPQDGPLGERGGLVDLLRPAGWQLPLLERRHIAVQRRRVPCPAQATVRGMSARPEGEHMDAAASTADCADSHDLAAPG